MNERMKVLELLQEGKITAEQAEKLLSALERTSGADEPSPKLSDRLVDKRIFAELKNIRSQVASAVTQSFNELKKIDWEDFPFPGQYRTTAVHELSLEPSVETVSVATRNGAIRLTAWDGNQVTLHIRGQVRNNDLNEAKHLLEQAMQVNQSNTLYQLTLAESRDIAGASIDIMVPSSLQTLTVLTQNGAIQADSLSLSDFRATTTNGSVLLYRVSADRTQVDSKNGSIALQNSVTPQSTSVYVRAENGTIELDGIASDRPVVGTAKTQNGRIDITGEALTVEYDDSTRRRYARFQKEAPSQGDDEGVRTAVDILCETVNGRIVIRG